MENANITIFIGVCEGNENKIDVRVHSKEKADVFITASSMTEARKLMDEAEAIANNKMQSYTEPPKEEHKEEKHKEEKHYKVAPVSIEEAKATIEGLEQGKNGKKFVQEIDNSWSFMRGRGLGLSAIAGKYLACVSYSDSVYASIMYTYDLAFRRGYNRRKREEKAAYK